MFTDLNMDHVLLKVLSMGYWTITVEPYFIFEKIVAKKGLGARIWIQGIQTLNHTVFILSPMVTKDLVCLDQLFGVHLESGENYFFISNRIWWWSYIPFRKNGQWGFEDREVILEAVMMPEGWITEATCFHAAMRGNEEETDPRDIGGRMRLVRWRWVRDVGWAKEI